MACEFAKLAISDVAMLMSRAAPEAN